MWIVDILPLYDIRAHLYPQNKPDLSQMSSGRRAQAIVMEGLVRFIILTFDFTCDQHSYLLACEPELWPGKVITVWKILIMADMLPDRRLQPVQCCLKDYKCFPNDKTHAAKPLESTIHQIIRISLVVCHAHRTPICLKEINH